MPEPASFMKKMISTAKIAIISVPYDWHTYGKECNHVTHHILYDTLLEWSEPRVPIESLVVREEHDKKGHPERIILVYET